MNVPAPQPSTPDIPRLDSLVLASQDLPGDLCQRATEPLYPVARALEASLAGLATNTRVAYTARLEAFLAWAWGEHRGLTRESVQGFLGTLAEASVVNQALSALKRLANEAAESQQIPWGEAVAIGRIRGRRVLGQRTGHWLDTAQVKALLSLPDRTTTRGKRDAALLALLFGCGLRRAEVCALERPHYEPGVLRNIHGKGGRIRTISIPPWAESELLAWLPHNPSERLIPLSCAGVYKIMRGYARRIGVELSPHDARRSFAKLASDGGASLTNIQNSLGHSSVTVTERYLGTTATANAGDFITSDDLNPKLTNLSLFVYLYN